MADKEHEAMGGYPVQGQGQCPVVYPAVQACPPPQYQSTSPPQCMPNQYQQPIPMPQQQQQQQLQTGLMIQPPVTGTTVTIIQQQPASLHGKVFYPQGVRDWDTGLCACCDDMETCALGAVAPFVLTVRAGEALNDSNSCCLCWAPGSGLLLPMLGIQWGCVGTLCLASLYTQTRAALGIRGSIYGDCCKVAVCTPCAVCQMARQLKMDKKM